MLKKNYKNIFLLSFFFFILLFFRRGEQLLYPYVWNEDGALNIRSFLTQGWANLLEPVQGYLITIPKLITDISLSISFLYYPEISTYITWLFTIVISLLIVYMPTFLSYRIAAATMVFLIPINAEPYGLPLYTFWFSTLLLFLVALWKPSHSQKLKNFLLFIAGISSPMIVVLLPVQLYRMFFFKNKKEELISFVIVFIISIIQLGFIVQTKAKSSIPHLDWHFFEVIIIKFFGYFLVGRYSLNLDFAFYIGLLLIVFLLIFWFVTNEKKIYSIFLYLLVASIALSVVRVSPFLSQPVFGGGARYYFFPYILLSWNLLYIVYHGTWHKFFAASVLILSVVLSLKVYCRHHDHLNWRMMLNQCQNSNDKKYAIPIHYDGNLKHSWHISLSPKICQKWIEKDFFSLSINPSQINNKDSN